MSTLETITRPIYGYLGLGKTPERFEMLPGELCLEAAINTNKRTPEQVARQIAEIYDNLGNKDPRIKSVGTQYENRTHYVTVIYADDTSRAYPITQVSSSFMMQELTSMGNQCSPEQDRNFIRILHGLLVKNESSPKSPKKAA